MSSNLREEIVAAFGENVASDDKVIEECISICQIYNLTAETLMYKWEALNFNPSSTRSAISRLTMDSLASLKAQLQRDLTKQSTKRAQQRTNPFARGAAMINRSRVPQVMLRMSNAAPGASSPSVKLERGESFPSRVIFRGPKSDPSAVKDRTYRYMYEKISEHIEVLDDRIDEFAELVREHYKIPEIADPSSLSREDVVIVGRITHESDSPGERSAEASLMLESSRILGAGRRVHLRFDQNIKIRGGAQGAGGLGLFPGAIAALKGMNGSGSWFQVKEILALPPPRSLPDTLAPKQDLGSSNAPFTMCISCGPYTQDTDLTYKPWQTMMKTLKSTKPAVLLLVGPFIDALHPLIKMGEVDSTPFNLFRTKFIEPLRSFLDSSPESIVLLVPSVRDLITSHAVFPQAELPLECAGGDSRIHLLPNPSLFSINDITFGVTSIDVLFHIRKDERVKRGEEIDAIVDDAETDAMSNLCRHVLQQRSFYPVFPVPFELTQEVNLDITHSAGLKLSPGNDEQFAPDVLILPSKLKQFSKSVHSTLALNPSLLTKGAFGTLTVSPKSTTTKLKERIKMEITKLEESA